jgi:hypothetical protein
VDFDVIFVEYMVVGARAGSWLPDALGEAVRMAFEQKAVVLLRFNGKEHRIVPGAIRRSIPFVDAPPEGVATPGDRAREGGGS